MESILIQILIISIIYYFLNYLMLYYSIKEYNKTFKDNQDKLFKKEYGIFFNLMTIFLMIFLPNVHIFLILCIIIEGYKENKVKSKVRKFNYKI